MAENGLRYKSRYFKFHIKLSSVLEGNKAGFIDPLKVQEYDDFTLATGTPEEYKKYQAKSLGYIRWLNLCMALSDYGIFYLKVNKETLGGTSTTTPTQLDFYVGYEQADGVTIKDLQDKVAFVLTNSYQSFVQVYDPREDTFGKNPSHQPLGFRDVKMRAENLVEKPKNKDEEKVLYNYITITEITDTWNPSLPLA